MALNEVQNVRLDEIISASEWLDRIFDGEPVCASCTWGKADHVVADAPGGRYSMICVDG